MDWSKGASTRDQSCRSAFFLSLRFFSLQIFPEKTVVGNSWIYPFRCWVFSSMSHLQLGPDPDQSEKVPKFLRVWAMAGSKWWPKPYPKRIRWSPIGWAIPEICRGMSQNNRNWSSHAPRCHAFLGISHMVPKSHTHPMDLGSVLGHAIGGPFSTAPLFRQCWGAKKTVSVLARTIQLVKRAR